MRIALLAPCLLLAACGDDDGRRGMAMPDAQDSRVSGCDDPALWTLPALAETEAEYWNGLGECEPAQLPLQRVRLGWKQDYGFEAEQDKFVDRVCWRVTEAAPGSGWTAGQEITSGPYQAAFNMVGFARPISVEGRALFQDGTIAYSIPPTKIELEPAMIAKSDASAATAILGRDGWAEHDAVNLWGNRIPTEEVLGATYVAPFAGRGEPITLHRVGANLVRRLWLLENNQVAYQDLVIGAGTRGQITSRGNAVLVDGTELVLLTRETTGNLSVRSRVTLPAEPLEMIEADGSVWVHFPGTLMRVAIFDGTTQTLAVGDGALVPAAGDFNTYFFDGTAFRRVEWTAQQIEVAPVGVTPAAEDLARLGTPVGAVDNVVFGENGLLALDTLAFGPRSVSYAAVFGDGHLGPLYPQDATTYVIEHDDGSAELYLAPYNSYCNPI